MAQKIREIMTGNPVTLDAQDTVADAARAMRDFAIGDVIVLDATTLRGLVTDRDIVVRVIAEDRDPRTTTLREICSDNVLTLTPDDDADTAVTLIAERAVRRIPILENDIVVGVVTIGDLAIERDERSALASVSAAPPTD
jgi:CBS domain-containing protein